MNVNKEFVRIISRESGGSVSIQNHLHIDDIGLLDNKTAITVSNLKIGESICGSDNSDFGVIYTIIVRVL